MAIFIDNVVTRSLHRKLKELGANSPQIEMRIKETLTKLVAAEDGELSACLADSVMGRSSGDIRIDYEKAFTSMAGSSVSITRDTFSTWLDHPLMDNLLHDADVGVSAKSELFDVLDVDMGGKLELD